MPHPCPSCNGCGERVDMFVVYDDDGNEHTLQMAHPCGGCMGRGEIDE